MLTALWEDREILVIDKPAGLATQPGAGVRVSLVEAVERDFGFRPFLVHRLDRETAGCIIVARDARSAAKWSDMIAGREVGKFYRAIVSFSRDRPSARSREGVPPSGTDAGAGALEGDLDGSVRVRGETKSARARWRLVGSFGGDRFALLDLELGTGRTHQLRLQLAGAGMPILGDDAHGDFGLNKELRKSVALKRLLLFSWRLVLPGRRPIEASEPQHFAEFFGAFPDAPAWKGDRTEAVRSAADRVEPR